MNQKEKEKLVDEFMQKIKVDPNQEIDLTTIQIWIDHKLALLEDSIRRNFIEAIDKMLSTPQIPPRGAPDAK